MRLEVSRLFLVTLALTLSLAACGPEATPAEETELPQPEATPAEETELPQPEAAIQILEATFAHGLSEEMQPVDPSADFAPHETIYLSLRIKGRPKEGIVAARFYWQDTFVAEASVDLADVSGGVIFSIGEDTYVGYTMTHEEPFPLSEGYRAEVSYNDQPLATYAFRVVPPPQAIPSQITAVTLARGADDNYNPIDATTTFAPGEAVYLVGRGDLGLATWLQADWYVGGQLDDAGTRNLTLEENISDTGFVFYYLPEGGWPAGEHFVILTMNGVEEGRYTFTVTP